MPSQSPSSSSSLHAFVSASLSGVNIAASVAPSVDGAMGPIVVCDNTRWTLSQGRAVTLKPRAAGMLRVTRGRAWVTLDVSRHSPLSETGDHFVTLGHDLPLRAGQRVVVEAWAYRGQDGIEFQ
ncbi:MAG: DUF2917 domain-containing protein [Rhodoferax sp.]|nr:DUF2917 domain-containing protein [Rhodoferax sp.]